MSIFRMQIQEKEIPSLIKQGKENEAINVLYKKVFPKVKSYILKQNGRSEDAYDMFQDAILYFYKQILEGSFNEKYTVFGYVFRLSINRWINKIKRDQKIQIREEVPEALEMDLDRKFYEMEEGMKQGKILELIFEGVGDKCREILTYALCYDLMIEDIMARMGLVSEGAAKMQVKRCKEKLYKSIEENPMLIKQLKNL